MMTLLEELKTFVRHILHWIIAFVGFSVLCFLFGFHRLTIYGYEFIALLPSKHSLSVQVFNRMRQDLLPPNVQLLATNPLSAFLSQILFSMILAFLITAPYFLYRILMYLRPALLMHERRAILWSLLPLIFLFLSGALFSYFLLIPATFKILYPYTTIIGAAPYFSINEFVYYVFGLMVAVGMMFLLPIFMVLLSFIGIVSADFWKRSWKHACLFFLISAAIITPDGTGITMTMLFLPLMTLYLGGYIAAKKFT